MNENKQIPNVSLYDFLRKPAGGELGKRVYAEAVKQKSPTSFREVKTKTYKGKIITYTREFLTEYFSKNGK